MMRTGCRREDWFLCKMKIEMYKYDQCWRHPPVGDQTPVLHGPAYKVWDGNHVLFGKRIGNVVIVSEEISNVGSDIQGVFHSVLLLRRGVHSELGLVDGGELLLVLEITDNEASQVSYHRN